MVVAVRFLDGRGVSRLAFLADRPEIVESPDPGDNPIDRAVFSKLKREIMIRVEHYKYVVDEHGAGVLLFDLQEDPHEQRNLVGHPDLVAVERDLRDRILRWFVTTQIVQEAQARPHRGSSPAPTSADLS